MNRSVVAPAPPLASAQPMRPEDAARAVSPELLTQQIVACRLCRDRALNRPLPHEPRPIFRVSRRARVLIASQAPGNRAHQSGIPFDDASGVRLRDWMGIDPNLFYDRDKIAIVPMGFCFPGYDAHGGDLPPRPECRFAWHDRVFAALPQVTVILAIGVHAIRFHLDRLGSRLGSGVGMNAIVAAQPLIDRADKPKVICLPHPSWRNTAWLRRNPWFETEVLPVVRSAVAQHTGSGDPGEIDRDN